MLSSGRDLTTACLGVYVRSGFMDVDGKSVHVGTPSEVFAQVSNVNYCAIA